MGRKTIGKECLPSSYDYAFLDLAKEFLLSLSRTYMVTTDGNEWLWESYCILATMR